jgi:hypothetical protein
LSGFLDRIHGKSTQLFNPATLLCHLDPPDFFDPGPWCNPCLKERMESNLSKYRLPPNPVSLDIMDHRDFDTARGPGVMECWSIVKSDPSVSIT